MAEEHPNGEHPADERAAQGPTMREPTTKEPTAQEPTAQGPTAEKKIDSLSAAKTGARMALFSVLTGFVCGITTWLFLTIDHLGVAFLWDQLPAFVPGVPAWMVPLAVISAMTILATVVVALSKGRPFDLGVAEAEYDHEGRMDYRRIVPGAAFSLFSLFSGAAVGPEAPLTDINGALGTFVAERLKLSGEHMKTLTYAGVAGAFGAFFGSAPVGALLAAELISPKALNINRQTIVAGLAAGATGWTTYVVLGGRGIEPFLVFADTGSASVRLLLPAMVLGVLGGLIGLAYGAGLVRMRVALAGLRKRYWLAGLAGGASTLAAALIAPVLLFSGQSEISGLIAGAATTGMILLLVLGVGKLALSGFGLSTAYFGGPIFPLIFAGTCFGLALHVGVPSIPQGVAVVSIVTGMVTAAAVAPLSVTIFIALLADPVLAPAIAIAAVASFIVRQAIAPTLPGVYRATRAAEAPRS